METNNTVGQWDTNDRQNLGCRSRYTSVAMDGCKRR